MLTEDYLMRMISMAIQAILRALNFRTAGQYEQAHQAVDQALELLFGMNIDLIRRMEDAALLDQIQQDRAPDPARLTYIADCFKENAEIYDLEGNPAERNQSAARALFYYLEAALADPTSVDAEIQVKVHELARFIPITDLPQNLLYPYFLFAEKTGLYEKARLAIRALCQQLGNPPEALEEEKQFLARLKTLSDAELVNGGLSTAWVHQFRANPSP